MSFDDFETNPKNFEYLRKIIEDLFEKSGIDSDILNDPELLKKIQEAGGINIGFSIFKDPNGETRIQPLNNISHFNQVQPMFEDQDPSIPIEPYTDVIEDPINNSIRVIVEIPGVTKNEITLKSHKNTLKIRGISARKKYEKDLELPEFEKESVKARLLNGVLEITLQKI